MTTASVVPYAPFGSQSPGENWYCLYTKPNMERQVAAGLNARGLETYLPMLQLRRKPGGRSTRLSQPLFPCYLFSRFDLKQVGVSAVRWMHGMRDLLSFNDEPAAVGPDLIERIRQELASGETERKAMRPRFQQGAPVRVRSGPFTELDAVFEQELSGSERAMILVNILGRMARAEVDLDLLEARAVIRQAGPQRMRQARVTVR